jgi:hypothetical protein
MDPLQTLIDAHAPLDELFESSRPEDFSTAPLSVESHGERTIDDVVEDIDRSIYAKLVAS